MICAGIVNINSLSDHTRPPKTVDHGCVRYRIPVCRAVAQASCLVRSGFRYVNPNRWASLRGVSHIFLL